MMHDPGFRNAARGIALVGLMTLLGACSGNDSDVTRESGPREGTASVFDSVTYNLPEYFPDQIPLTKDHVIVRNESRIGEEAGRVIAMNIALSGTIDHWREQYEQALDYHFEDIEFIEDHASLQWRFRGQGFDYAVLYLNDNRGYLDRGEIDSTHLPVMLTLTMIEHRD